MGRNGAGKSSLLSRRWSAWDAPATAPRRRRPARPTSSPARLARRAGPAGAGDLLYSDTVGDECAQADSGQPASPPGPAALFDRLAPGVPVDQHPRDLSEGQRLTLALAIVLAARPPLVLLDEPTRGLDYTAKHRLVEILRDLAGRRARVVLATHDVELVAEVADRVVVIADGEVVADGPTADVVVSSPAFAPQVAKVLAPQRWLTPDRGGRALAGRGP